jgi:MFS family permease
MLSEFTSIFKTQKFMYLWTSQMLSQVTVNIMNFLLLARLYTATHSSIAVSLLWVSYSLPALIIGPIGAASVDLFSRRKMLMITNLLQAVTVFIYIFINQQSIFILYAIVLAYSALNQFYGPAEAASLPSTVDKSMLARANSLFFMTTQAALILGFGFAGILQRMIGFNGTVILCALFLFIAFVSVSFLDEIKPKVRIPGEFEKVLKTFFDSIVEGYEFISKNKTILFPLLILLGIQAVLAILVVSLPVIALQILNISVNYSGISIVVPAGLGALLGSVYIPRLIKRGWRRKILIEMGLGIITFSLLTLSLGIPFLPLGLRVSVTPLLIVMTGFAFVGIDIPALTFLQESTPDWFRGRVFGNLWFMTTLITIFPVLFSGTITEIFGVRALLSLMAIGTFLVLMYSARRGQDLIENHLAD